MKTQRESEFFTRMNFRMSYHRAKFRSRMRRLKKCIMNNIKSLMLLISAVLLITLATIIIRKSYEDIFRKPASLDQVDTSCNVACLHHFYYMPVHECQAGSKRDSDGLFQD